MCPARPKSAVETVGKRQIVRPVCLLAVMYCWVGMLAWMTPLVILALKRATLIHPSPAPNADAENSSGCACEERGIQAVQSITYSYDYWS